MSQESPEEQAAGPPSPYPGPGVVDGNPSDRAVEGGVGADLIGRSLAEVQDSEGWFRQLTGAMPQIVWTATPEGAVEFFNARWYEYTGMAPEASLGLGWRDAFHREDLGTFAAERERGIGEGGSFTAEIRLRRRDGSYRWHLVRSAPIRDAEGHVSRRSGTATDIDDSRRAEEALRASEERFARFMQHLPGLAWIKDARGRYLYVNDAAERAFQTPRSDLYGKADAEVFPPETAAMFVRNDRQALEGGSEIQVIETLEHGDGVVHHSLVSKFPIPDAYGRPAWVGGMAIDVTDRLRTESALRESEARFRHLAGAIPQIVWISRPDQSTEFFNERWFEYTGLTAEESYGPEGWRLAVHPDDASALLDEVARTGAKAPFEAEYRLRRRDGVYRWHLGRGVPVLDEAGNVSRSLGTATDIDDRRRAEQDARFLVEAGGALASITDEAGALRQVARSAVPHFADWCAIDLLGEDGSLRRVAVAHNDPAKVALAFEVHRRYPTHPDTPRGVFEVIRTGEPALVPEITDAMLQAGARDADHLRIHRELGLKSYLCVPLLARGGTMGAIAFVAAESGRRYGPADLRLGEDLARRASISVENARLYDALREADRRKDEFLATLAHELRNPLAPIRNALHLMARPDETGEGHEEARAMAERQVVHLSLLVDDLMDVARISKGKLELKRQIVSLGAVIDRAVEAIRSALAGRGHELVVELPAGPIFLDADPTRLEQILDNLLTNAIKYTEPGGRIVLSAARDGKDAEIRVADSGIGIPGAMIPRVFEMFAQVDGRSARAEGGLGIGLGLVKSLVEMHGGSIRALSDGPGSGSEFVIRLPAIDAPADDRRPPDRGPARELPRLRLLVVDDNVDAANSLAWVLRRLYNQEVRAVHDGPGALALASEFRPDVVLLDIGMPEMDGFEVARRLRSSASFEEMLIVALTGWGQESDRRRAKEAGFDHHLVKPVDPEAIRAILADRWGRPSRPG